MTAVDTPRATVSAEAAVRMTAADPAFSVPTRPRLLPGLVTVPMPGGLLVEGAERRQVFRGTAATEFLPRLLARLASGSPDASVEAHAEALGVDVARARAAVALLYASGLLDDTPEALRTEAPATPVEVWAARHLDTSRLHRTREDLWGVLRTTTVAVVGPPDVAGTVAAGLADAGLGVVQDAAALTVVVSTGADDVGRLRAVEEDARRRGTDWLRVLLTDDAVEVGPVGGPDDGRCVACLLASGALTSGERRRVAETSRQLGVAVAVTQVVQLVTGSGRPMSTAGVLRLRLDSWEHELVVAPRVPGCPGCSDRSTAGLRGGDGPQPLTLAHVFDAAVRFPAVRRQRPKDHQQHYAPRNLALQREAEELRLRVAPLPPPVDPGDGPLDVALLGTLLHRAFGWQQLIGGEQRRCAPTGGNIGSPTAYVVARQVAGLAAGCYRYVADRHGLVRVADLPAVPDRQLAPLTLVLTGDVGRTSHKYIEFGTRVVHLDAGVATAQLRLVAAAHRLAVAPQPTWDDLAWAAALDLDVTRTPVTQVLELRPDGDPSTTTEER